MILLVSYQGRRAALLCKPCAPVRLLASVGVFILYVTGAPNCAEILKSSAPARNDSAVAAIEHGLLRRGQLREPGSVLSSAANRCQGEIRSQPFHRAPPLKSFAMARVSSALPSRCKTERLLSVRSVAT